MVAVELVINFQERASRVSLKHQVSRISARGSGWGERGIELINEPANRFKITAVAIQLMFTRAVAKFGWIREVLLEASEWKGSRWLTSSVGSIPFQGELISWVDAQQKYTLGQN